MDRGLKKMIEHAKKTKKSCMLNRIIDEDNTAIYAEQLLTEISVKLLVADQLGKDLKPIYSIFEQAKDILGDVLGSDNFDI